MPSPSEASDASSEASSEAESTVDEHEPEEEDDDEDDIKNLPKLTHYRFQMFWERASKLYDLVKLPVVNPQQPRSKFQYVVKPGSRRVEDSLTAYRAVPYFNARKRQFRKAFVAFAGAIEAKRQQGKRNRAAANKRRNKKKKRKRQRQKDKPQKTKKARKTTQTEDSEPPNDSESDVELDPKMDVVDSFLQKMQREKKRYMNGIAKELTQIEARVQAIKEEALQLESRRTKLQAEEEALRNVKLV